MSERLPLFKTTLSSTASMFEVHGNLSTQDAVESLKDLGASTELLQALEETIREEHLDQPELDAVVDHE